MSLLGEPRRRPTNLSLREDLVARAKELDLNVSRIAESALAEAVRRAEAERWLVENAPSIDAHNAWIERHGLPLRPPWLD